jgi:hypothetical protein
VTDQSTINTAPVRRLFVFLPQECGRVVSSACAVCVCVSARVKWGVLADKLLYYKREKYASQEVGSRMLAC